MAHTTALYVGIDVSKETLAVATYPLTTAQVITNDPNHCERLAHELAQQPVALVLLEASGGFEKPLVQALQRAGVPGAIVPTQRARYFAKRLRGNLKTDRVDAQMLARFARCYPVSETPDLPAVQAQLKELWARREQLVQQLEAEKKRLQVALHPLVRSSLERTLAVVQEELAQIEAAIAALVASDEMLQHKAALLQTAVGVGAVVAYGLLAELARIGAGVAGGDCGVSGLSACASGERSVARVCADWRGASSGASVAVFGGGSGGVARCALEGSVSGVVSAGEGEEGGVMYGGASVIGGIERDGA
jgi:transposase